MTKEEFISNVPLAVEHQRFGYGELRIISDYDSAKGAGYAYPNGTIRGDSFGEDWSSVYEKISQYLKKENLLR